MPGQEKYKRMNDNIKEKQESYLQAMGRQAGVVMHITSLPGPPVPSITAPGPNEIIAWYGPGLKDPRADDPGRSQGASEAWVWAHDVVALGCGAATQFPVAGPL